jgi:hypothetical protein
LQIEEEEPQHLTGQDGEDVSDKPLYECNFEGCTARFQHHGNLLRHIEIGKHTFVPVRQTLRDYALHTYADHLEERITREITALNDALKELQNPGSGVCERQGWAVRDRAPAVRFSQDVHYYLKGLFENGKQSRKKLDPKVAEQKMKLALSGNSKRFKIEEYLHWRQIQAIFSKLSAADRNRQDTQDSFATSTLLEVTSNEEDNDFDSEPMITTEFEEVFEAIRDRQKTQADLFLTDVI